MVVHLLRDPPSMLLIPVLSFVFLLGIRSAQAIPFLVGETAIDRRLMLLVCANLRRHMLLHGPGRLLSRC